MLDRKILERLGQLNRESLPTAAGASAENSASSTSPHLDAGPTLVSSTVASSTSPNLASVIRAGPKSELGLEESPGNRLHGGPKVTDWGEHWLIEDELSKLAPGCEREMEAALRFLPALGIDEEAHPEVCRFARAYPEGTLYLDLETCGFAGSMVFLVGLLHWKADGTLVMSQLLARNYAEEKAILQSLWELAAGKSVLVTFNGKSFDWPVVQDRSTLHHLGIDPRHFPEKSSSPATRSRGLTREDSRPRLEHFDLLHHSRRHWRRRLPNCRLQTLEYHVCGRRRVGDIPGQQIPEAYHHYARTEETRQIRSILHHNALDLLTLWQLSIRLPLATRPQRPEPPRAEGDTRPDREVIEATGEMIVKSKRNKKQPSRDMESRHG